MSLATKVAIIAAIAYSVVAALLYQSKLVDSAKVTTASELGDLPLGVADRIANGDAYEFRDHAIMYGLCGGALYVAVLVALSTRKRTA